jgi:hypothetical protein
LKVVPGAELVDKLPSLEPLMGLELLGPAYIEIRVTVANDGVSNDGVTPV